MEMADESTISMLKAGASLVVVLFLMVGLAALFKYFTNQKHAAFSPMKKKRLNVVDMKAIDHRHKMVLVQRDNVQHLLLLSGTNAPVLIEQGINAPTDNESSNDTDHQIVIKNETDDKYNKVPFGFSSNSQSKKA